MSNREERDPGSILFKSLPAHAWFESSFRYNQGTVRRRRRKPTQERIPLEIGNPSLYSFRWIIHTI